MGLARRRLSGLSWCHGGPAVQLVCPAVLDSSPLASSSSASVYAGCQRPPRVQQALTVRQSSHLSARSFSSLPYAPSLPALTPPPPLLLLPSSLLFGALASSNIDTRPQRQKGPNELIASVDSRSYLVRAILPEEREVMINLFGPR